jgi:hypothetical protein
VFHEKSKHLKIKYHYIRDMVQRKEVLVQYLPIDCVSLDNSYVLLQWLCTIGSDCISLDNGSVLLVDYKVFNGLLDEYIMERYLPS